MRHAMAEAEVGDDVYGDDPTGIALQEEAAALMGFPAALFVPSGTMGNLIAVQLHARRGTEAIVEANSHVYNYELAAMAAYGGRLAAGGEGARGVPDPAEVDVLCRKKTYYQRGHAAASREHAQLRRRRRAPDGSQGGAPGERAGARRSRPPGRRPRAHAAIALALSPAAVVSGFDSVCSALEGLGRTRRLPAVRTGAFIEEARVIRKRLGGGMRQVGVLAPAGRVALRDNIARPRPRHERARRWRKSWPASRPADRSAGVETNIVIAERRSSGGDDPLALRIYAAEGPRGDDGTRPPAVRDAPGRR